MTLRKQTLAIVLLTTVALVAVLFTASRLIVLQSFSNLEDHLVNDNMARVIDAVSYELATLENHAADWAEWDDTYNFVEDVNEHYVRRHHTISAYTTIRANTMLFFNSAGQFVFAKGFDLEKEKETEISPHLKQMVLSNDRLLRHKNESSHVRGLLLLPEGPVLFSSRPILTSQHQGPIRGTLVMTRDLNDELIRRLSQRVHVNLKVERSDNPDMPSDFAEASTKLIGARMSLVRPLKEDLVAGYAVLKDTFGQPALLLRMDMNRDVYRQGRSTLIYFLFSMLSAGLVFCVVTLAVLEKRILSRLIELGRSLRKIAASGKPWERVTIPGKDELASLADDVNGMLSVIEQSEVALRESEERLKLVLEGSNDGFWDWNIGTGEIHRNRRWAEMLGYSPEEIEPRHEAWQRLVNPEDLPAIQQAIDKHLKGNTPTCEVEYRLRTKSGRWKWILDRGKVVARDEHGKPVRVAGAQTDITERKLAEEKFRRDADEAAAFHQVLLDLSKIDKTDSESSIDTLLRCCGSTLRVQRAGFWSVAPDLSTIELKKLYRLSEDRIEVGGSIMDVSRFPHYIENLHQCLSIVADNAQTDERTREFCDFYLKPLGITSMLDAAVWVGGELAGIVCLEHIGQPRSWSPREQDFVQSIAEMVTLTLEAAERKRAEEALKESEEKYRLVVDNANEAIIVAQGGKLTFVNPKAIEMIGYSAEELTSRPFLEFIHPEDRPMILERYRKRLREEILPNVYVFRFVDKNGNTRWAEINAVGINWHGEAATLNFISDITAKRRMEEEFIRLEKIQSLGVLAGGIAHDFNNILTAILGNISLAKLYSESGGRASVRLSEAQKACLQAQGLTQQLLTFSKGGAPVKKVTAIGKVLNDSCLFALRGSDVRLNISIPEDTWPVVIDEGQISQVIANLVMNADQAMPRGGVLDVRAENVTGKAGDPVLAEHGKYVKISVIDQGIGIPEELLSRIFDPYFTTKQKGSGLGLATAYSIIKNHEGFITVDSQPGLGATFCVFLPASEEPVPPAVDSKSCLTKGHGRVLLMDDEESVRDLAQEILSLLGYEAVPAKDGTEAIDLYKAALDAAQPFDAIIMDLTIPGGMGGAEAAKILREADPDVKVIVSSGYSNDPIMAEYKHYGFADVVAKPYGAEELGRVLARVIAGKRS